MDFGDFYVRVTDMTDMHPVGDAFVSIFFTGDPDAKGMELMTDESGITPTVRLETPPFSYSQQPDSMMPYSLYTVIVRAQGYEECVVSGNEIFADTPGFLNVRLLPAAASGSAESIDIAPHTLYGDYPPKIKEEEIKPETGSGEIVLSKVVIPQYIIVHDGPPDDRSARDYYVTYKDYIKNVACSEIYPTWPQAAILANILAIMSFTLNRVYTEWYRNKGYSFTITSSTAYDHKWIYGRNYTDNVESAVDTVFTNYLSRPNVKQPILTQYCDGKRVSCPGWMSQWGSKYLADRGLTAIEILRNYYGDDIYINTASQVSGIPSSYPGYPISRGSRGDKVLTIQNQLNVIAGAFPAIPKLKEDGIFGPATENSVKIFQKVFNKPQTGIVDFATWYKISEIYVGVSRIAELR